MHAGKFHTHNGELWLYSYRKHNGKHTLVNYDYIHIEKHNGKVKLYLIPLYSD